MFKSISKRNLWMIAQNATLAVAIMLGFSLSAKAEKTNTYPTLKISCNPFISNNLAKCNSNSLPITKSENQRIAQSRRGRRGVRSKGNIDGYYGGVSVGIGFLDGEISIGNSAGTEFPDAEYDNGFVGSAFGGIKFTKNFSADIEFMLALGGIDTDEYEDFINDPNNNFLIQGNFEADGDYSALAVYLNPRLELPLTETGSFNLYFSPGIGIAQTIVELDSEDSGDFAGRTSNSNTGFAYQVKGGASYLFNRRIGIFGQLRYASMATGENDFSDVDNIDIFSIETGLELSF